MAKSKALTIKERDMKDYQMPKAVLEDPRKLRFLYLYFNRESETYGNALQSALKAGFAQEYAESITYKKPKWLSEYVGNSDIAKLCEEHFAEVMMLPNVTQVIGAFGPVFKKEEVLEDTGEVYKSGKKKGEKKYKKRTIKTPVMKPDVQVIKEKTAVAKIALPAHDEKYKKADQKIQNNFLFDMRNTRSQYAT